MSIFFFNRHRESSTEADSAGGGAGAASRFDPDNGDVVRFVLVQTNRSPPPLYPATHLSPPRSPPIHQN
jgi:hypothetical protein